ncbi:hypothetical protein Q5P01_014617 [Channa striata]|uniref:Arrestin C-terminal-like domain-containing protein n=1 Tax=Channa striata TaxID=64152 RepID=A0AA88MHJ9_CHASR|nr:hypothetical protein Q5P01_014617 [Channa striata]
MSPIKNFSLTYEALNQEGTFSEGDALCGSVTFTLTKDTNVKSVFVKAKGDANVHWTEGSGDNRRSYSAHRRYFKVKDYLVLENSQGTVLPKGAHNFKFRLQIPHGQVGIYTFENNCIFGLLLSYRDMPPSFTGHHGKIVYMLEAKLSRSWRWPSRVQKEIKFVLKSFPQSERLMCPYSGSVSKKTGVFSKGKVQMSATVNRKGCSPGDTLSVVATVSNSSSKTMRPKFCLLQKIVYRAGRATKTSEETLSKVSGETLAQNSTETVSCQIKIPVDVICTLYNCDIISVDYFLRVYVDISFAIDPGVVFPLVIIPSSLAAFHPDGALGLYPSGAVGGPSYSDFRPPAFLVGAYPVPTGIGAYGYPAPGTNQQMDVSGYNNQQAQQAAPYGFSAAAFTAPSVQDPTPTVPPPFQQGAEPPSYMSIFPTSQDNPSSSGSKYES